MDNFERPASVDDVAIAFPSGGPSVDDEQGVGLNARSAEDGADALGRVRTNPNAALEISEVMAAQRSTKLLP
jgi:hypothetical protein